jgi:uncharacterized cupin superfamily protein
MFDRTALLPEYESEMPTDLKTTNTILDAFSLGLDPNPIPAGDILRGTPTSTIREVMEGDGLSIGVWELTPGTVTDTEADEVFVVLSGRATVEFDGDDRVLHLGPGTIGRLGKGARTRWTVSETLRKVYILPAADEAEVAR